MALCQEADVRRNHEFFNGRNAARTPLSTVGPDRVKTLSEFGGSGAAVCQFGLELPKYLDEAEDGGQKRSFSGPHGLDQRPATQYFHYALKIIGKHVEPHFGTDPIQCSGQEVRAAHP